MLASHAVISCRSKDVHVTLHMRCKYAVFQAPSWLVAPLVAGPPASLLLSADADPVTLRLWHHCNFIRVAQALV